MSSLALAFVWRRATGTHNRTTMRILFVHFPSDLYGAGRSLVRLTGELTKRGHTVHVLLARDGHLLEPLRNAGATIHVQASMGVIERSGLSGWGLIRLAFHAVQAVLDTAYRILSIRPNIVHTNTGIIFSGALGATLAGVPHVWHLRDWFGEFPGLWRWYSRFILAASARVICVSAPIAAQFPPSSKVRVVNNGFDMREFIIDESKSRHEFRHALGLADELLIGMVGRIKLLRKGQDTFVRAASLLEARGIHARYVIVGSPYQGNETHLVSLRQLIDELGLKERVALVGELSDTLPAYAAMDIFVLPSAQPEPFGGVVMEAMALGRPVIATNIGGSPEQVVDGVTGLLISPNDPLALADALERMTRDCAFRERCGRAGRKRIEEHFRLTAMVDRLLEEYAHVLNQRRIE